MGIADNDIIYIVKCPQCKKKANAIMRLPGVLSGTYREAIYRPKAKLIQCNNCGFIKELPDKDWNDYELWYKTKLKGHSLWAVNEKHLNFMIQWFSKKILKPYGEYERAEVESISKMDDYKQRKNFKRTD